VLPGGGGAVSAPTPFERIKARLYAARAAQAEACAVQPVREPVLTREQIAGMDDMAAWGAAA
jgi:hypothetical protein